MLRAASESNLGAHSSSLVAQTRAALAHFDNEKDSAFIGGGIGARSQALGRKDIALSVDTAVDTLQAASPSGDPAHGGRSSACLGGSPCAANSAAQEIHERSPIRARHLRKSYSTIRHRSQSSDDEGGAASGQYPPAPSPLSPSPPCASISRSTTSLLPTGPPVLVSALQRSHSSKAQLSATWWGGPAATAKVWTVDGGPGTGAIALPALRPTAISRSFRGSYLSPSRQPRLGTLGKTTYR